MSNQLKAKLCALNIFEDAFRLRPSYAIGLTHEALLPYFETIKRRVTGDPDLGKLLRLAFVLAAIAFSVLVLKWLETPARKGLVKWFSRTNTTPG